MPNILKRREAGSNQNYNGFDLSHDVYFTSSVGHIIPIHYDILIPGDKLRFHTDILTRLQPSNSASPIEITEHVDYFFVPFRLLYGLFPSMVADTNDWNTSLVNRGSISNVRDIPMSQIGLFLYNAVTNDGGWTFDSLGDSSDSQGDNYYRGARTLLQMLGYGDMLSYRYLSTVDDKGEPEWNPINPDNRFYNTFLLQAYQCVWQWYYRLDTREELDRFCFNTDDHYNSGIVPIDGNGAVSNLYKMLQMRYRPWKRDLFTSNEISPLGNQASLSHFRASNYTQTGFENWIKQWYRDMPATGPDGDTAPQNGIHNYTTIQPDGTVANQLNTTDVKFPIAQQTNGFYQTTQQHRIAAAIEKLAAIWQQSGKTYKDQMEKQFGVKLDKVQSPRPIYIGSDSSKLTIDPIVSDVETSEMPAGTITGYGVNHSKDGSMEFQADEHGIFLALYSAVPEAVYKNVGLDPCNTWSSRKDYPLPVTDELGQQPMFAYMVRHVSNSGIDSVSMGWLPRNVNLKVKNNISCLGFLGSLAFWIPTRTHDAYKNDLKSYYVSPWYLNDIMLTEYGVYDTADSPEDYDYPLLVGVDDSPVMDVYGRDPLLHFFKVRCFKSTKQSTYGVPQNFFG